ncbi:MAG: NADH-quinone oxidoreductase subunit [Acidimicrobiia bacterium]|jgi:NADH-quinone oxidoreductase subunit N|nr:NADH-quinone oxidoreductase subunit [Acidimicrobiia bacterium]
MIGLLAQAITDKVATPRIDWWGVMPVLLLAAPAMVLLHLSSLVRHVFRGFYAAYTIFFALFAAAWSVGLWFRVTDESPGKGPFSTLGGAFGVDGFSVFLTVVLCSSVILAALMADGYLRREGLEGAELYSLLMLSASGGIIMASANDLILLFLGLEILSLAVYVLAAMHLRRVQSQEAGMKYFVLGAFSSAFFLYGIALVYGATGSTSLIAINTFLADNVLTDNTLLVGGFALLLVGFGFKVAAVPFHSWSPDVYQGAPSPAVVYMASGVKAAGFAGLLRVFVVAFGTQRVDWQPIVYVIAVATLVVGTVLAVVQDDVKRMMAYSSISHAGFILVGVQAATQRGTAAALFYLAAYTFMIGGTFGVITLVGGRGDERHSLRDYRGLGKQKPLLALALTILLLAQTGVPLTSGFFAKFGVIVAAVDAHSYWLALVAMVSAVVAAFVYLRIIVAMYMSGEQSEAHGIDEEADTIVEPSARLAAIRVPATATVALALSVGVTIVVGILPGLVQHPSADAVPALVQARR